MSALGNHTPIGTTNAKDKSEVRAMQQKLAHKDKKIRELERENIVQKREDGAKIKELKQQVRRRVDELLETERKWKLLQSDS